MRRLLLAALLTTFAAPASAAPPDASPHGALRPPQASAGAAPFTDANDPYLWLEDVNGPRSMAWVESHNQRALGVLEKDPRYPALYQQALALAQDKDRIPAPRFIDREVYNFWQDADHVRGLWRTTTVADYANPRPNWRTVLDIDALSKAEGANWVWKGADCERPRERLCLVSLSDGGEDAVTLREFDLAKGGFVDSGFTLPKGKQRVAWENEDTLLLAREWGPASMTGSGYPFIVKRVKRGRPLAEAVEVFRGAAADGGYGVTPAVLHDAQGHEATIIERPLSTFEAEQYLLTRAGPVRLAVPLKSSVEDLLDGRLLIKLEQDWTPSPGGVVFPQGSLVSLDLAAAMRDPRRLRPSLVFAPGPRQALDQVTATRDQLLLSVYDNVKGRAYVYSPSGTGWTHRQMALPDNASVGLVSASDKDDRAFVNVTSFLTPTTLWFADAAKAAAVQVKALPPKFDASRHVVEQFEAVSRDGTRVPYFVVHPRGIKYDGSNPTLLYAYGGFQVSQTPAYSASTGKLWLERGGTYVLANIRGGGEFGPAWHDAGLKTKRQVVYDDFAAVAQDLVARKITSPRRLGIRGGSNGGLLMGVEFTQNPELWNAVIIDVPLLDMLRIEKIAAGASWAGEYGSVSDPAVRAFWQKLSPYHNLRTDVRYPEPFIFTTTKDDRVGPVHARKFAARMEELGLPFLFYENTEGGHAAGANLRQVARTQALEMTYLTRKLMDNDEPRRASR